MDNTYLVYMAKWVQVPKPRFVDDYLIGLLAEFDSCCLGALRQMEVGAPAARPPGPRRDPHHLKHILLIHTFNRHTQCAGSSPEFKLRFHEKERIL